MARIAIVTVGRMQSGAISEFEDLLERRLPNWGKWGRHDPDKPDPNNCGYSLCRDYIPEGPDQGWDDETVESKPAPINFRDAEELDFYLFQMIKRQPVHFKVIARRFYKRQPVAWDDLAEGIRGLMDLLEANRWVVERMKKHGY